MIKYLLLFAVIFMTFHPIQAQPISLEITTQGGHPFPIHQQLSLHCSDRGTPCKLTLTSRSSGYPFDTEKTPFGDFETSIAESKVSRWILELKKAGLQAQQNLWVPAPDASWTGIRLIEASGTETRSVWADSPPSSLEAVIRPIQKLTIPHSLRSLTLNCAFKSYLREVSASCELKNEGLKPISIRIPSLAHLQFYSSPLEPFDLTDRKIEWSNRTPEFTLASQSGVKLIAIGRSKSGGQIPSSLVTGLSIQGDLIGTLFSNSGAVK